MRKVSIAFALLLWVMMPGQLFSQINSTGDTIDVEVPFVPNMAEIQRWIVNRVKADKLGYCYKQTKSRNGGSSLPTRICPDGMVERGALCYLPCETGYKEVGLVCYEPCPPGYTDAGVCWKNGGNVSSPTVLGDCPPEYTNTLFECYRMVDAIYHPSQLADCPEGYVNEGAWCHRWWQPDYVSINDATCSAGYTKGFLGRCYYNCPAGYTNNGDYCGRGDARMTLDEGLECPAGYWKSTVVAYCFRNCEHGYTNTGEFCISDSLSHIRKSHIMEPKGYKCPEGYVRDPGDPIGLCYKPCPEGYYGVITDCYQNCPTGYVNCGLGCAVDEATCFSATTGQVLSVLTVMANIASLGMYSSTNVVTGAVTDFIKLGSKTLKVSSEYGRAAVKVIKALQSWQVEGAGGAFIRKVTIRQRIRNTYGSAKVKTFNNFWQTPLPAYDAFIYFNQAVSNDFATITSPEINNIINSKFEPETAKYIKEYYAKTMLVELQSAEENQLSSIALSAVALIDPTGIAGLIEAYNHPSCGDSGFGDVPTLPIMLFGDNLPTSRTGAEGNYFIHTLSTQIFGPKTNGFWPNYVSHQ